MKGEVNDNYPGSMPKLASIMTICQHVFNCERSNWACGNPASAAKRKPKRGAHFSQLQARAALRTLLVSAPPWRQLPIDEIEQMTVTTTQRVGGPFHASFRAAGGALRKSLAAPPAALEGQGYSLACWFRPAGAACLPAPLLRLTGAGTGPVELLAEDGWAVLHTPAGTLRLALERAGAWTWIGVRVGPRGAWLYGAGGTRAHAALALSHQPFDCVELAPRAQGGRFAGLLAGLEVHAGEVALAPAAPPREALLPFEPNMRAWPLQTRQQAGLAVPQASATLPRALAGEAPLARAQPLPEGAVLEENGAQRYLVRRWQLSSADAAAADGAALSAPGPAPGDAWLEAVVPGTVLTTLIARGQVPDPGIGLANLEVPEALCRQDWWYRSEFELPGDLDPARAWLRLDGVNYAAEVWCNGTRLGSMRGAFVRGQFELAEVLRPGQPNVLAVRVSPPPHPGIPHEQSLRGGPGANGGILAIDGPTFVATEGWDWIPGVRDRNTGLWQAVELGSSGPVRLGDAQVVAQFPGTPAERACLELDLPLHNLGQERLPVRIDLALHDLSGRHPVRTALLERELAPGRHTLRIEAAACGALDIATPSLWWPNGYGEPNLYAVELKVHAGGACSDARRYRFGIRKLSYELSLVEPGGALVRVEAEPARARADGQALVELDHQHILALGGGLWAPSLHPAATASAALRYLPEDSLAPFMVLRVNDVRIAVRGGNWGMDDWLKRVERSRLEPYFRLHREANMNTIRNWVGQCTEPAFFELADEYGLLVLNDFWASTQDHQVEPQDPALFLANARDVLRRYRNHPCIAAWIGRNEGVPQPVLNQGLDRLVREEDGSRLYLPNSRQVNLQESGPWNYREPRAYFDQVAQGFSTEIGTQSFPTLEAFEAFVPAEDRWPINDTWAYHDWHSDENGDTAPFEAALAERFGPPTSLEDFERKAQMLNFDNHRAIFEGMNGGLWQRHSGRLLWMSHPAWPSTQWQIYSHDYDTHAAFYGARAALEPVHAQLNLPGHAALAVNVGTAALGGAQLSWRLLRLDGTTLGEGATVLDLAPNAVSAPREIGIEALLRHEGVLLALLELHGADGRRHSRNLYWLARSPSASRGLNGMPEADVQVTVTRRAPGAIELMLVNATATPSLHNKLTLLDGEGQRVLPAYYSDNYISLLPGEALAVRIEAAPGRAAQLGLRAWNGGTRRINLAGAAA